MGKKNDTVWSQQGGMLYTYVVNCGNEAVGTQMCEVIEDEILKEKKKKIGNSAYSV